ncbi:MAG: hypothetical protein JST54_01680 [Deltaproteobacteria bacterium]|nr:hypothetical protein [Deltaproteobacteria bacterium]
MDIQSQNPAAELQVARCPLCAWSTTRAARSVLRGRAWLVSVVARHLRERHGDRVARA